MPDLNVTIGADLSAYNQALAQATSNGQSFANSAANGISNAMDRVESATERANQSIALSIEEIRAWDAAARNSSQRTTPLGSTLVSPGLPQQINAATQSIDQLTLVQQQGGQAALSYSANLQQVRSGLATARSGVLALTLSGQGADRAFMAFGHHFSSLINETGSVNGAFKSLANSLVGAGGIILGLTLAIELWHKYSESQEKAEKSTKNYIDTLDSVRKATLQGQQDGANEVTRLNILYNATQNHTLSIKQRNEAYDELERKYPKFFSNSDREATLLGNNKIKYEELATAILAAASAKAYENQIGENSNRIFQNDQKKLDLDKEILKTQAEITRQNAAARISATTTQFSGRNAGVLTNATAATSNENKLNDLISKKNNLITDSNKLTQQNQELAKKATDSEMDANFKTGQELDDKIKKEKKLSDIRAAAEKLYGVYDKGPISQAMRDAAAERDRQSANILNPGSSPKDQVTFGPDDINEQMEAYAKLMNVKQENAALTLLENEIYQAQQNVLGQLTQTIGEGLTSAFQNALAGGQNFFSAFGEMLLQLIEKLIAAAAAAAILSLIIGAFTGGASIAAQFAGGGGFGKLLTSFSGIGGLGTSLHLASGGITNGPTRALIGEGREREAVMPLSKLQTLINTNGGGFQDGQIIGVLSGDKLLLQYNRAQKSKLRIG